MKHSCSAKNEADLYNEFEKESCVLIIQETLSFIGFLGLLLNRFKLDVSLKSYIRVFTDDGCRIKSLKKTYNNQIINFKISTLSDEDPEDEKTNKLLTKSQEYAQEILEKSEFLKKSQLNYLKLFSHTNENQNLFYNNVITKLITYTSPPPLQNNNNNNREPSTTTAAAIMESPNNKLKTFLIIGESYPYRCKVLISEINNPSRIWVYFIEESSSIKGFKIEIVVENDELKNDTNSELNLFMKSLELFHLIENKENVIEIVEYLENYYKSNLINFIDEDEDNNKNNKKPINKYGKLSNDLFQDFKNCKTVTRNKLLDECYSSISKVSTYYDIPISLSRKLLFQNQWKQRQIIGILKDKEKNLLNIKSFSCAHRVKDISLVKFNSLQYQEEDPIVDIECSICYCEYSPKDEMMIELICGHRFCKDCMNNYFKISIQDGNGAMNQIKCPQTQCLNNCIDEVTIETILIENNGKKENNQIYLKKSLNNFIKDVIYSRPNTFKCPELNCNRLLLLDRDNNNNYRNNNRNNNNNNNNNNNCCYYSPYVQCNDNHIFCLYCKQPGLHWPSACNKSVDLYNELLNYSWIINNTTICKRCKYPIEKNGGCNHVTCSRCYFQFCYVCGEDFLKHSKTTVTNCTLKNGVVSFLEIFSTKTNDFEIKFLETFLTHGSFHCGDSVVSHIYNSFITTITDGKFSNKDHLKSLQTLVLSLFNLVNSKANSLEEKSNLFSTQKIFKKLLSPISNPNEKILFPIVKSFYREIYGIKNYNNNDSNNNIDNNKLVNSLSVTICLNGSKKSLFKLFVNSQFHQFKEEIVSLLNKTIIGNDQIEYDSKKIRLYNLYGGQIKNSNEILNNEAIFITHSIFETFIQDPQLPNQEEKEKGEEEEEDEDEEDEINNQNNKESLCCSKKEKRKNDIMKLKEMIQTKLKVKQDFENYGITDSLDQTEQEYTTEELFNQFYIHKNSLLNNINQNNNNNNNNSENEEEEKEEEVEVEEEEGEEGKNQNVNEQVKREKQVELAWSVMENFNEVDEAILDFDRVLKEIILNDITDFESAIETITLILKHSFVYDNYEYDTVFESYLESVNGEEYYDHDEDLALSKIYKKSVSKF
ncbi:hypothetical protein DDB_G0283425 [Dictyostelium discoideum AX4]|uniref:RBR-type E3 ubiquitin transferase n=1 Tax=Dictyostelium discoideum TaxID=44689 RepID=Q54R25_DICDI|nr:hypothetical protein DDB_G0283425 [Dictyostelium discoideum AX4]EAL65697.1 hypothetical protein DDB_G0283425 [Dictyostelium discoideum AX4]|eukprot:XP_639066.1 hypothetical protein DDB_G0283425 [Dictyostelium discoideum AX4]